VIATYALLVLLLIATYPVSRAEVLHTVYMAVHAATVVIGVAAIGLWLRRSEPAKEVEHFSTLALLGLTNLFVSVPFVLGAFLRWEVSYIGTIVFYCLLSTLALRGLISRRSTPLVNRTRRSWPSAPTLH
jgi:hypothetical protein